MIIIPLGILSSCESDEEQPETVEVESDGFEDTVAVVDYLAVEEDILAPIDMPRFDEEYDGCWPTPNDRFLDWKNSDSIFWIYPDMPDELYIYLMTHMDSSERVITATDSIFGPTEWYQEFENGFVFSHHYFPEKGSSSKLITKCNDYDSFYPTFMAIVENDDNEWNEDHTEYAPDGAGCWYSFLKDSEGFYVIEWSCGC